MSKYALCGFIALVTMAAAAHAQTYRVEHWPGDIDTIPCEAWTKMSDGTWALKGRLKLGASEVEDIGVKGDAAARSLDKRCGK
jgi:hypothetical protein